jgi:class 3 adenylate cyclase/predicted ATPase
VSFEEVVDQASAMLQRRGRLTYRMLQRHFHLDAEELKDLTFELIKGQRMAIDEDGEVLVWTGEPLAATPDAQRGAEAERRFHTLLPAVIGLLQSHRRVTYRTLTYVLSIDKTLLEEIREELTFRQLAIDEGGQGLVWTGEVPSMPPLVRAVPSPQVTADTPSVTSPAAPTLPPYITETQTPSPAPTISADAITTDVPQDTSPPVSAPTRLSPEAERRQVTVLFCDLVDSTKLSQHLDAEDYRAVVRAYQAAAVTAMQPWDGYVAQYLGDGLMVYFGWPTAHEDAAVRAVHASLALLAALEPLNTTQLAPRYGVRVQVRLGLHTGMAVIGDMGGGDRREQLAMGDTPNIAARLQGLAAPDTVVLSAVTARLVQRRFALETLGTPPLKGVTEPMPVFRVLGLPDTADEEEADTPGSAVFLVGRDEELGLLRRRWEQSKAGLGQVVLISGEAGIGKSSLVETLRAQVRREGLTRVAVRCSPYHTNSALYPVIEHVQRVCQVQRDDTPAVKLDKLERTLRTSRLPLEEVVPLFAALLSVPLPEERYAALRLTPQQQKQQTYDALVAWMLEEDERQPVLVVWEDLHWADPSTLEYLSLLLDQSPTAAILNLLTFRPAFVPPWPSRSHMTPLTLTRLERPQVEALITHLAGDKTLPAEVVAYIVARTDGVPLFVEELTKMLLESALLHQEAERYTLTGPLSAVAIPTTLQDSLMARLDRLPMIREVAQLGAVLGREFAYEMLRALAGVEESLLQDRLAQLVDTELLYQRGRPPRARYIFKHALVQDAAYASLLKSTRQQYHQQVAQMLEARFPATVETEPELVARHYTEAGCSAQAVGYWQQAGQRAIQRSANVEAIAHLRQGIELLTTLPDTPERVQAELTFQTTLGPALMATRGYAAPEVAATYNRARELCQQAEETPELFPVLWGLWLLYMGRAEHETAREFGEQCLSLARRLDDPALLLEAHLALGASGLFLGQLSQAHAHLDQGIRLYDPQQHHALAFRYGNRDPGVAGLAAGGWTLWLLGYPEQALERANAALTLAQHLEHPYTLARGLYWTALLHQWRREWQVVSERAETMITVATEHQVALMLAQGPIMRGWALAMQGQGAEGLTQLRQGLDAYRATGAEFYRPHFLSMLAEVHRSLGQPAAGLTALREALALVETTGERYYEAELHRLQGELQQLAAPEVSHAEACFQQALAIARGQQAKSLELRAAMSLSRLWQQQGKRDEARALLAPIYGWFTEGFDTADLQEARALLEEFSP